MDKYFRFFLADQLVDKPSRKKGKGDGRSKKLGYVYVASDPALAKSCRSYATLKKMSAGTVSGEQARYWTPNSFFHGAARSKNTLRWINALVLDIDEDGLCLLDIYDRVNVAGLPRPTMINKTPHGWHVYWAIVPIWAWPRVIKLYESIMVDMINAFEGADNKVFGPERFFRLPGHVKHFEKLRYTIFDFMAWREINYPGDSGRNGGHLCYMTKTLKKPAVKHLLEGVEKGSRNSTAYTLALCFKKDGFDVDSAYGALEEWNKRCSPPMPIKQLKKAVKSAYNGRFNGPSSRYIEALSGMRFKYRPITPAKARRDRKRHHLSEIRDDILNYLYKSGGYVFGQSQEDIAKYLGVPLRSFKIALEYLRAKGKVFAIKKGAGRACKTLYALPGIIVSIVKDRVAKGVPIINFAQFIKNLIVHTDIHLIGEVVGGSSLWITENAVPLFLWGGSCKRE